MSKGLGQEFAADKNIDNQPRLDKAAIPRTPSQAQASSAEPAVELSGTSFKFKLDPAQTKNISASMQEPLKAPLSTTLSKAPGKFGTAARNFSLRRFLRLEAGRTVIDGMLAIATAVLKLLDKILMFLLRSKKPILTRLILPKPAGQLEELGATLAQKKKKLPGRDGAAMA